MAEIAQYLVITALANSRSAQLAYQIKDAVSINTTYAPGAIRSNPTKTHAWWTDGQQEAVGEQKR